MENALDAELKKLKNEFAQMCRIAESMLSDVKDILCSPDTAKAREVAARDKEVDESEADIERGCMRLLLRNQPFARDFRSISCLLKAITDVERIADQAADIAGLLASSEKCSDNTPVLVSMGDLAVAMVRGAVNSLLTDDLALASDTVKLDDRMDDLFDRACGSITDALTRGGDARDTASKLMIAKYFERIGDHAVNICEWTQYIDTGEHRKYQ